MGHHPIIQESEITREVIMDSGSSGLSQTNIGLIILGIIIIGAWIYYSHKNSKNGKKK